MLNLKKTLSVFLSTVLVFTTLCFFAPVNVIPEANAQVVNADNETVLYVPETIYLYPDVTSWTSAVETPFQYYVGNTVDTANIYNTPSAEANLDSEGKIYFAAKEGMNEVRLSVKFLDLSGNYLSEEDSGTVSFTAQNKGTYYLFTVTEGVSPLLSADESGAYIEWCVTYKTDSGEEKAVFNYTYIYKPYVVPYGAATRVVNEKGDANIYGQYITWVTGVHSVDTTPSQTHTLYPYYMPVSDVTLSSDNKTDGKYSFSPFLSKDNKAYVGGVEVSGAAPVANGSYYPVFSGTDASTAYFWANQTGAEFTRSYRAKEFFYAANASNTYPVAFDYFNNSSADAQYVLTQVTPTKLGAIKVDISRYNNLNEIPNLAVGMLLTDTDVDDSDNTRPDQATAQWYIGDATGFIHSATGSYPTKGAIDSACDNVNTKFASQKNITVPTTLGIKYAGVWNSDIDKSAASKQYTVKSYYEAIDRELDRQAVAASVSLNVTNVDKTALREAVDRATSYFGTLGVKENWNSYYYDINYIDPDTNASAWTRFENAYKNACGVLGNVDSDFTYSADEYAEELNAALDALLSGKGLRVYFDVNHDDIGVNLWINPKTTYYEWNAVEETAVINGEFYSDISFGATAFTPDAGTYTVSAEQISGSFNGNGCVVFDSVDENRSNVTDSNGYRYNVDFKGTYTKTLSFAEEDFIDVDGIKFWSWYNSSAGNGVYNRFAVRIKIEKGSEKTEYSPVGKVTGTTYGTLPTPTREGYLFDGWCTDETLAVKVDESSAVSARILYAKWEKAQYNVVFDGNGATDGVMPEQTFTYDEKGNLNENVYVRTGYTFSGWKDAEDNFYSDGAEIFNLTSTHQGKYTLYAQWTPNQYSVALDGNTGIGGIGMFNAQYDESFDLPENYFIKTGYTFIGWAASPEGEVLYGNKENVSNLTSDFNGSVTLYAAWQANTFTVTFDANTAEGEMADMDVVYDSGAVLPQCGFTRTGYTFIGWSLTADGAEILTDAQFDNLKTEEGDTVTVYAVWSENSYTLNFDMNGGEGEKIPATVYDYEETVELPKNVFTKTGYILAGWSLTRGGELVYANGETVQHLASENNGSVTLYAVWTPVSYTIRFNAGAGAGTMADITATYDEGAVLTENTFTKEGYHFAGWSTAPGGEALYSDGATVNNLAATEGKVVNLYAVWEINVYTVTFVYYNNQGVLSSTPVSVNYGETAKLPSDFTTTPYMNDDQHRVFDKWSGSIENIKEDKTVTAAYPTNKYEAHDMAESVTDSTCAKLGSIVHYCTKCSYSYSESIPMKSHQWNEGEVKIEPGCLTNGSFVYTCYGCGGTKAEAISPVGHDFVAFPANESTCSTAGNIAHKHCVRCERCYASDAEDFAPESEALSDEEVKLPKLPHTPGAEADCENDQICTVCGETIVEAYGHTEATEYITTDATCTNEGSYTEKKICTVCDTLISSEEKFGKLPHEYEKTVTAPTCTDDGFTTYSCKNCSESYVDEYVTATGHSEGEWKVTQKPTCTKAGIETNYCSVCFAGYKTREAAATGHDSGEWKTTIKATCTEWGTESLICTVCDTTITTRGISPKGHGDTKWEVTIEAGCTTAGRNSKLCVDCGAELTFEIIPEKKHSPDGAATCEKDSVCLNCGEVLTPHFGHRWNAGVVTKEPTEFETGIRTYTCQNNVAHTYTEEIPVLVIISIPEIPADGTYDLDADKIGSAGNVSDIISVADGLMFTVTSSDINTVLIDAAGNITVKKDGEVTLTVRTTNGKYEKSFKAYARILRTVTFDINGEKVNVDGYIGDKVNAPEVDSYTDSEGFFHKFKAWSVNGTEIAEVIVTGDMTAVAVFTSSCDYSELDRLEGILDDLTSGAYDNAAQIVANEKRIKAAREMIAEFKADREIRDISDQALVNAAAEYVSTAVVNIYPEDGAYIEIRGENEAVAGTYVDVTAYLMPVNVAIYDGVWQSSDTTIGFFSGGKFFAVKSGTVTLTVGKGSLSSDFTVTIKGNTTGARVIMFDTLLTNVNYIVENTYIVKTTTNVFWAPDAPIHFRLVTNGTFEEYQVYFNNQPVYPDADGIYTIPANVGDVHVKADGLINDPDDDQGGKMSFWDAIVNFFKKIGDFFRSLFGM